MFLDFLLKKINVKNHLIDALSLALPLVFQIHLPMELDEDDLPLLKEMLMYAANNGLPERCINNIVTGLLLHNERLDVNSAKSIIWSLTEVNCTAELYMTRYKLLNMCFDVFAEKIDDLKYDFVLRTLGKLKSRIIEKHPEYYNEKVMDAIGDYVVRNNLNFEKAILIARSLSRIVSNLFCYIFFLVTVVLCIKQF